MHAAAAALALLIERIFGYPRPFLDAVGHPVMWMGALIEFCDTRLNRPEREASARKLAGVVTLLLLLAATLLPTILIVWALRLLPGGWLVEAILATTLLAQKELGRAVRSVAEALGHSLAAGRKAVSAIVGRDPDALDAPGVARAAIESLAENASDGVIAPLFWLLLFGLPGIAAYKAINTADSMVGHLNARYTDFGWASARLDDWVNWLPARLSALLFTLAALLVPGAEFGRTWSTAVRDAGKHASPNAGWPEAAMAGALGLALGGPRAYHGEILDLAQMGDGRADLSVEDILKALALYRAMLNLTLGICVGLAILLFR